MKRVLALLLVFMLCICALVSCGEEEEEPHVHTFSESWTADAEGHWYAATCECEEVEITKLAHSDKNNDGACDVCEYKIACADGHSYAEEWTVDCTNHWHAADCGHVVAGSGVAAHADANNDGKCDTCFYVIRDIHNHYYDDEWSGDAEYHWHAALCEHGVEVADKAAHVVDAAGYCTVCEAKVSNVNASNIEAVLLAAIARNHKVTDGNIVFSEMVFGGNANALTLSTGGVDEVYFVLGANDSYIFLQNYDMNGNFIGADHQWYERISEKEIFAVQMQHGTNKLQVVSGAEQFLSGYTYHPGSILPSADDDTSTLANTLYNLYSLVKAGTNVSDATESYDATTGEYKIAFNYLDVNATHMSDDTTEYQAYYYQVAIRFTVDANAVINFAEFSVMSYRNWEGDEDISYDPTTNKITFLDSANPTVYSYSVSQRSGDRTYTTIYPKTSLVPTDFELSYVTEIVDGEYGEKIIVSEELLEDKDEDGVLDLELTEESYVYVHLTNLVPVTAIASALDIGDFSVTFVNNDSTSTGALWLNQEEKAPGFSSYTDCITFFAEDAGEYTVTITFGNITKTVNVTVAARQVAPVDPVEDNEFVVETTDTYVYEDEHTFIATKGEGKYTFTLPPFLGIQSKEAKDAERTPEYDVLGVAANEPEYGQPREVVFELEANEEFVFYVGATTKGNWIISYTYVACDVEDDNQGGGDQGGGDVTVDISGTYTGTSPYQENLTIVIDDTTITFTHKSNTVTFDYELDGSNVIIYNAAGEPWSSTFYALTLTAGVPTSAVYNGNTFDISAGNPNPEPTPSLAGTYTATDDWGNSLTVVITDTTITFTPPRSPEIVLEYEYDGVFVTLYSEGDVITNPLAGNLTVVSGVPSVFSYNGTDYALTEAQGGGDPVIPEPTLTLAGTYTATDDWGNSLTVVITDTTITFTPPRSPEVVLEYEYDGVSVTLYSEGNVITNPLAGKLTVVSGVPSVFSYNGTDYALAKAQGGGDPVIPEPTLPALVIGSNNVTLNEEEAVAGKDYMLVVTEAGNFTANGDLLAIFFDSDGMQVGRGQVFLEVGTYTVKFVNISEAAGDFVINLTYTAPAGGGDEGDDGNTGSGTEVDPYIMDSFPDSVTFESDTSNQVYYIFTAQQTGNVTFTWSSADSWYAITELNEDGTNTPNDTSGYLTSSFTFAITEGTSYKVQLGTWDNAGETTVTITLTTGSGGAEGGEGGEGDDNVDTPSYDTTVVIGENTLWFSQEEISEDSASRPLIITEAGNYMFNSGALFVGSITLDGEVMTRNDDTSYDLDIGNYVVTFSMLSMFGVEADVAQDLNVVNSEESEGGEEGGEEITVKGSLDEGYENEIEVTDEDIEAGKFYLNFMPDNSGEYYFTSGDLFVTAVTLDGEAISLNENDKYVLESYTQYVLEVSANFVFDAGVYNLLANYSYPLGRQENPFWYDIGETVTASYDGILTVWYQFYATATGTLTLKDLSDGEMVILSITRVFGNEVTNVTYDENWSPVYGETASMPVVEGQKYYIGISNDSWEAAEIEFTTSIEEGEIVTYGTANVPHYAVIGDNTAAVVDGTSVYFMYKLEANGTVTFTTASENCYWYVTDSLSGEVEGTSESSISFHGYVGDTAFICICTADYSSADIVFNASFKADPVEVYYEDEIISDGSAANEIVIEENTYVTLTVYANGNLMITWDNADAIVSSFSWMTGEVYLSSGDIVAGSMYGMDLTVYLPAYAAGTVNLTITPCSAPSQDLVIGDNTVSVTDTFNGAQAIFVAPENGTYTFTVGFNGVVVYDYSNYFADDVITINLLADETVEFSVFTENRSEGDVAIAVAKAEAGAAPETAEGEYRYVDPDSWTHRWQLILNNDGTGIINEQNFDGSALSWTIAATAELTYTYSDGTIVIDFADGAQAADGSYSVSSNGIADIVLNGASVYFEIYV